MSKTEKNFYIGKGAKDEHPYLYYGEKPPIIFEEKINGAISGCEFVGSFQSNPIADSIKNNEIVKIYIRKQTRKMNKIK